MTRETMQAVQNRQTGRRIRTVAQGLKPGESASFLVVFKVGQEKRKVKVSVERVEEEA